MYNFAAVRSSKLLPSSQSDRKIILYMCKNKDKLSIKKALDTRISEQTYRQRGKQTNKASKFERERARSEVK